VEEFHKPTGYWPEIAVTCDVIVLAGRDDSHAHESESDGESATDGQDAASRQVALSDSPLASYFDVLLVKRKYPPFEGCYALPGGGVELGEDLEDAARRELLEETGIVAGDLAQFRTFGAPGRDPRCRVVSVVYWTIIDRAMHTPTAGSDAEETVWFPLAALPPLAFDHAHVLKEAMERLFGG
jgi:ADP-ribose pyrophosphatase YjhB (NUDIX family)